MRRPCREVDPGTSRRAPRCEASRRPAPAQPADCHWRDRRGIGSQPRCRGGSRAGRRPLRRRAWGRAAGPGAPRGSEGTRHGAGHRRRRRRRADRRRPGQLSGCLSSQDLFDPLRDVRMAAVASTGRHQATTGAATPEMRLDGLSREFGHGRASPSCLMAQPRVEFVWKLDRGSLHGMPAYRSGPGPRPHQAARSAAPRLLKWAATGRHNRGARG